MHKKRTNVQHDKNEERWGPNPEKVEARRASARRVGARRSGGPRGRPRGVGPRGVGPRPRKSKGPKGWGRRVGARRVGARRVGAQNFALFFHSPAPIFALFLSLWRSFGGILVVFEAPGPSSVHVWRVPPSFPNGYIFTISRINYRFCVWNFKLFTTELPVAGNSVYFLWN